MDDDKRARVRTLTLALQLSQEEVLLNEEVSKLENRSVSSDATDDLEDALVSIKDAIQSLESALERAAARTA